MPLASPPATARETRLEWRIIAAVLLLAATLRATALFTGQRHLRSDEAVVGVMARHVTTQGARPVFLYGQPYGGGHAITAYLAAPLFAVFGASGALLTAVPALLSLVSVVLVWRVLRPYVPWQAAVAAAGLYAFTPPVVYQALLVNGGTESFLLALVALLFFLKAYLGGRATAMNGFLAGLFCGLAYYAMDYALLYPIVFALLWLTTGPKAKAQFTLAAIGGLVIGMLPLLLYNFRHDWAHARFMFAPSGGPSMGLLRHVASALWGILSGGLAAYFGGDIDDFHAPGPGAWVHAALALAAVAALVARHAAAIAQALRAHPFSGKERAPLPAELLPAVFALVYIGIYAVARFSLPELRTPRYFLPLCPFLAMAIVLMLYRLGSGKWRAAWMVMVAALVAHGAVLSLDVGTRPWHEEHGIETSGREIALLSDRVRARDVRVAFAPYEIQWRLMFETDEAVAVSSHGISPVDRYPPIDKVVSDAVWREGRPFAMIFRKDFAFAEWAFQRGMGTIDAAAFKEACRRAGIPPEGEAVGEEFVLYYPLDARFIGVLVRVIEERNLRPIR